MKRDSISAVVATKNNERTLEHCLRALRPHVKELVVVDGLSRDKTLQIAERYADQIFSDGGKGLAYGRDLGWRSCTNDYIALVGSDVIVSPQLFELAITILERDRKIGALAGKLKNLINNPRHIFEIYAKYSRLATKYERKPSYPTPVEFVNLENTVVPSAALKAINGFDHRMGISDNIQVSISLRRKGYRLCFLPITSQHLSSSSEFMYNQRRNAKYRVIFNRFYKPTERKSVVYWTSTAVSFAFPVPYLLKQFLAYSVLYRNSYDPWRRLSLAIAELIRVYLRLIGTVEGYRALSHKKLDSLKTSQFTRKL